MLAGYGLKRGLFGMMIGGATKSPSQWVFSTEPARESSSIVIVCHLMTLREQGTGPRSVWLVAELALEHRWMPGVVRLP